MHLHSLVLNQAEGQLNWKTNFKNVFCETVTGITSALFVACETKPGVK
jgi:hypothetical protein